MHPKDADRLANSVDPVQTAPRPRPICPKTQDHYGRQYLGSIIIMNHYPERCVIFRSILLWMDTKLDGWMDFQKYSFTYKVN